jgi:hypothetical protein
MFFVGRTVVVVVVVNMMEMAIGLKFVLHKTFIDLRQSRQKEETQAKRIRKEKKSGKS